VDRVHERGETALLVKGGRPCARIVPVPAPDQKTADLLAFLPRWRLEHLDPDEPFAAVIEASRNGIRPPHYPWE
jgi:antitoxin (DNA-binding transcriptional repressor) of toxin-antitoxin stability system